MVLQDLLEDLSDRVVVAVTFLAMLELVKGRELIVAQDEPFGPIVCRSRSAGVSERAAGARSARAAGPVGRSPEAWREGPAARQTMDSTRRWHATMALTSPARASVADIEALLFVAERPLSRAELRSLARLSAEERGRAPGRPGDAAARPRHPPGHHRRAGHAGHARRRAARSSRATWAPMPCGSRRPPWRRWPSWPTGSP